MKHLSYILVSILLFTNCEQAFLGSDEENSPENNFEIFWKDFDEHYALFGVRNLDWDSIYNVYRPQVQASTTDLELWEIFKEMIAYLDDSHTLIKFDKLDRSFSSGSEMDSIVEAEFSYELVRSNYLENPEDISSVADLDPRINAFQGKIKEKDIGYIYVNVIYSENENYMDEVLGEIGKHKAIILDLRNNLGGTDEIAAQMAGRFAADEEVIYTVQEKNGPEHNDFTDKRPFFTKKMGSQHFSQPLIVLTDRITVSAAEVLLIHLKSYDQVSQIGDATAGDFSDVSMRRFLPNGIEYQYSTMKFLLPDGQSLDGKGHTPDVYVRNTIDNIAAGEDVVFERAIQYLFEEYGIE